MHVEEAYKNYRRSLEKLQAKEWSLTDKQNLECLYNSVRALRAQSSGELAHAIGGLESEVRRMRTELHHTHYMSPLKKVVLGLGLAFLSASAARFWINKLEPVVETYVHEYIMRHPPTPEEQYFHTIDQVLHGEQ